MKEQIKQRTKQAAVRVARLCAKLPRNVASYAYSSQVIRSSSSVGANYRAACLAKSTKDFINKLKIVEEESDETIYFLELIKEVFQIHDDEIVFLIKEYNEILAIIISSIKTVKVNQAKR